MGYGNSIETGMVIDMNEEEYIEKRINDQIHWYSGKSQTNQKKYKRFQIIEIGCAAIIPFFAGLGEVIPCHQIIIGVLGIIIAISAGISALNKYQENWIAYRTTAETLKHEKYLFLTKCKPYDDNDAFQRLVQRVEELISKENSQWSRYTKKEDT